MGVYSEARVDIQFHSRTPEELTKFEDLLNDFVKREEGEEYSIDLIQFKWYQNGGLSFKLASNRLANMEWQIETIADFFRQYKHKPTDFTADVMEQSDLTTYMEYESFI